MQNKIRAYKYFGKVANTYGEEYYKDFNQLGYYPANKFRLNIVRDIIKKEDPQYIIDIGCGTGDPMVILNKYGYDVRGFDYSDEMVNKAKANLELNNMDPNRVWKDNMEGISNCNRIYPCAIALGSLYYADNFDNALKEMIRITEKNGNLIFSLRNTLFSLFSQNKYSFSFFLDDLINKDCLDTELYNKSMKVLSKKFNVQKDILNKTHHKNIDDLNIRNEMHNPLLIEEKITEFGLDLINVYYYHFHASLPEIEIIHPKEFYKASSKMENPLDWRGMFMASAFVVHARKV